MKKRLEKIVLLLFVLWGSGEPRGAAWQTTLDGCAKTIMAIVEGTSQEYFQEINPVARMVNATFHWDLDAHIPGWILVKTWALFSGVWSLTYQSQVNTHLLVVTFKGAGEGVDTDENITAFREENDRCGEHYLLTSSSLGREDNRNYSEPCLKFNWVERDYYYQARRIAAKINHDYPGSSIIYAGYSLGGVLAKLITVSFSNKEAAAANHRVGREAVPTERQGSKQAAIAFAAKSVKDVAQRILRAGSEDFGSVVNIIDENDWEISEDRPQRLGGTTCWFKDQGGHHQSIQRQCEFCHLKIVPDENCHLCRETHGLEHYLSRVQQERPTCKSAKVVATSASTPVAIISLTLALIVCIYWSLSSHATIFL